MGVRDDVPVLVERPGQSAQFFEYTHRVLVDDFSDREVVPHLVYGDGNENVALEFARFEVFGCQSVV